MMAKMMARLHRVTGLALLVYLFLHVRTIHELSRGPAEFDAALAFFRHPLFKLGEIGLLAAVIVHGVNGVRLIALDLGSRRERQLTRWSYAAAAVLFALGAAPMFLFGILKVGR